MIRPVKSRSAIVGLTLIVTRPAYYDLPPAAHRRAVAATAPARIPYRATVSDSTNTADIVIDEWRPDQQRRDALDADLDALAEVLREVVYDGAGVSFVVPFSLADSRAFWTDNVLPGVLARTRRVVVARFNGRIVGTVQVDFATPPNQQHRGEVAKLLVHPSMRRRGIARRLMIALEAIALAENRTLLTLDTWTGSHAEALYRSLGYLVVGTIPRFARGSTTPQLEPTTIMYKELRGAC